ncbi:hypothetical protein BU24DRAFT_412578 [Aaosphaeria arxii CBS 175.79]|uniref:Uncharacterized protein n=1 Tax=Aaosphaeria arxii CBS 175.79 TaxID=1450172 RepID=A0A6A5XGI8_9PLEO|nr:uncharacterized protein BU24DRAFT_412578 [Aaosphaeria arxii CBS 175.79]KAF2012043.1 hypothetical protein BU24DRAFT_412578 [Aaosphaeria arxii CBS 175.79]
MAESEPPMQRYLKLSSQQENIRRKLSLETQSPTSPEFRSMSSSPTESMQSSMHSSTTATEPHLPSPMPIPIQRQRHSVDYTGDDAKRTLCDINQQMKATLTELLNQNRSDDKYRAWVQEKLLETEQQIRKQRRRHSSGDREMAASIATHFSPTQSFASPWH